MRLFLIFIGSLIIIFLVFITSNYLFGNEFDFGRSIFYPIVFSIVVTASWAKRFKKREEE